jgi:hypothetical protein
MPAQTTCPISGVDRALSSYINSREDTLRIRRTLSKYLTASLRPVNSATQNQHLSHECPQSISATNTNPPGLKGQRLEYLLALRAKSQAQARHRELQQSLEDLHTRHVEETPTYTQSEHNNEATGGYVALLRQRRKHAELEVVQDALDRLLSAKPIHALQDPRALVQQTIGEQPDLPSERLPQDAQSQGEQSMILKLKQEVLEARASMDRANLDRTQAQSKAARSPPALQQQVHALERARDEIVDWVQCELGKLEEDSVFLEDASPIKRPAVAAPIDLSSADSHIRNAYDQYTLARASLIESWGALDQPLQTAASNESKPKEPTDSDKSQENKIPVMPAIRLLPHLPHLARSAQTERALLQQSVYLQTQIASADQEIEEALLRLSAESHLLPAGSKDVSAWGSTATEAGAATSEFVKKRLQASRQEIASVGTIVELCSLQSKVLEAS